MSSPLPGPLRAAAFLLSLEKDDAVRVMRHLDPEVVADVAEAMTELDPALFTSEAVEELYRDLARLAYERGTVRPRDDRELRDILEATFGAEEAERVLRGIHARRREEQPFGFAEDHSPAAVGHVLAEESPAVVALVLAHISPSVSAQVLGTLQEDHALAVVKQMTNIRPPGIETLLAIADDLEERVRRAASIPAPPGPEQSLRTVADLLNFAELETERHVLEGLEQEDLEVANQVREYMFTWEDLAEIEKRAMQKILSSVDMRTLSMALKGSSEAVESNIVGNLSARVQDMVADERDLLGPVPMAEVQRARAEFMLAVRGLMDAGEFNPVKAGEELVT